MPAYPMTLSAEQLKTLLECLESQFGQAILENVADICFPAINRLPDNFRFDDTFDLSVCEKGRAFGEQMELRWRRRGEQYVALLITDIPLSLPHNVDNEVGELPEPKPLESVESETPLQITLWGEWQDPNAEEDLPSQSRPYWYEERIPKFLAYPWHECDYRLAIEVAQYRVLPNAPEAEPGFPGDYIYRFVRVVALAPPPDESASEGETPTAEEMEEETND